MHLKRRKFERKKIHNETHALAGGSGSVKLRVTNCVQIITENSTNRQKIVYIESKAIRAMLSSIFLIKKESPDFFAQLQKTLSQITSLTKDFFCCAVKTQVLTFSFLLIFIH